MFEYTDITIPAASTRTKLLNIGCVNKAINKAAIIKETASSDVNMIFGAVVDEDMGDEIRITVIATGFDRSASSLEGEQSFFRGSPQPRQTEQPKTVDYTQEKKEQTQSIKSPSREQYVYSSDIDVDMPTFMRKNRNR